VPSENRSAAGGARIDARGDARARILETAYDLFAHHGIRGVGVDRIIAESAVAKMSLYRHFASKDDLAVAFLELREQRWTRDWLEAEMERVGGSPRQRLLAVFDAFDEWFQRGDFEGCSFLNTVLEIHDSADPVHREAVRQLDVIRAKLEDLVEQTGAKNPAKMANQLQILMMGAIMSASRGDHEAARHARELAEILLETAR
jgi:AcrR family transcriptional regulator